MTFAVDPFFMKETAKKKYVSSVYILHGELVVQRAFSILNARTVRTRPQHHDNTNG